MDGETLRNDRPRNLFVVATFLAATTLAVLPLDLAILRAVQRLQLRGDLSKFFDYSELFGHGLGVAAIIATVVVLDDRNYRRAVFLVICSFGSGLLADASKLLVARTRPYYLADLSIPVSNTFVEWFPPWSTEALTQSQTSFPSGHTATAFGLAVGLGVLYPKGRYLFLLFATLAACQRIATLAHYPSDVFGGGMIAFAMTALLSQPWSITASLVPTTLAAPKEFA
jgi:membrane-associated phospholipid phosphatase